MDERIEWALAVIRRADDLLTAYARRQAADMPSYWRLRQALSAFEVAAFGLEPDFRAMQAALAEFQRAAGPGSTRLARTVRGELVRAEMALRAELVPAG
jgi:hypothetical protein